MKAIIRFIIAYGMIWLLTGCGKCDGPRITVTPGLMLSIESQTNYAVAQCRHGFEKWAAPQRNWDNTWTQARTCTNCGYAEMRVALKP